MGSLARAGRWRRASTFGLFDVREGRRGGAAGLRSPAAAHHHGSHGARSRPRCALARGTGRPRPRCRLHGHRRLRLARGRGHGQGQRPFRGQALAGRDAGRRGDAAAPALRRPSDRDLGDGGLRGERPGRVHRRAAVLDPGGQGPHRHPGSPALRPDRGGRRAGRGARVRNRERGVARVARTSLAARRRGRLRGGRRCPRSPCRRRASGAASTPLARSSPPRSAASRCSSGWRSASSSPPRRCSCSTTASSRVCRARCLPSASAPSSPATISRSTASR